MLSNFGCAKNQIFSLQPGPIIEDVLFLRDIAPRLGQSALPFASGRVAEISASLSPSDRFDLLCLYIARGAELIALLKPLLEDPELRLRLIAYPSVMAAVGVSEASLVENLRAAIGED